MMQNRQYKLEIRINKRRGVSALDVRSLPVGSCSIRVWPYTSNSSSVSRELFL